MTWNDSNTLAVIEIALYSPILLLAAIVLFRLKFGDGLRIWLSAAILCVLRIAGASLQLATINHPTSNSLFEWSAILSSIGLSPLFLATIGVLLRLDQGLDKIYKHPLRLSVSLHHTFLEIATVLSVALILAGGIEGGKNLGTTHVFDIDGIFKAGVAVIVVTYAGFCDASIFTFIYRRQGPLRDFELFMALYASMPLILVRLIYTCLTAYSNSPTFNITTGNTWVRLGMTIIMEVLVVIMYLSAGLTASFRKPKE